MNERIHHVGIAVKNLSLSKGKYLSLGYSVVEEGYDPIQLTTILLMEKEGESRVELIYAKHEKSPAYRFCNKYDEHAYHTCYCVDTLETAIKAYLEIGFILISEIAYAPVLKGRISFVYSKVDGLIELLEMNQ